MKMNKLILTAITSIFLMSGLFSISTGYADTTQSFTISSEILSKMTVTKVSDLKFPTESPTGTSFTKTVDAAPSTDSGSYTPVEFDLSGSSGEKIRVTGIPTGSETLTATGGATMQVSSFTSNLDGDNEIELSGTPGSATVYIGATETVGESQAAGNYTSSPITLTFAYA